MQKLLASIQKISLRLNVALYVVGGAVRDRGLGRKSIDIDFATAGNGLHLCRDIARELGATFVPLDENEQIARLVHRGLIVDFARFKGGVSCLDDDLGKRDFTINSMAIPLADWLVTSDLSKVIDPFNGAVDLESKCIRLTYPDAINDDPLRMIRGFRLLSLSGFSLDASFVAEVSSKKKSITNVSVERILSELHLIMQGSDSGVIITQMVECGLLAELLSELTAGSGIAQPASHHLDVFEHNLEALRCMDQILLTPERYFPDSQEIFREYLKTPGRVLWLKWAALCHDIGKTLTFKKDNGKITFYNHDHKGARLFYEMGRRLTFSNRDLEGIGLFISQHMRPFFLCNDLRAGGVSTKACLRLAKSIGDDLPGLFLLSMADSLAGCGENKPEKMEEELNHLFRTIHAIMEEKIRPVLSGPPLLTGKDLINFGLTPGPLFKQILAEVEQLHVDAELNDVDEALAWLSLNY